MPTEQMTLLEVAYLGLIYGVLLPGGIGAVGCAVMWVINEGYALIHGRPLWPDLWQ